MAKGMKSRSGHPTDRVLVEACRKDCPAGFVLVRQIAFVKNLGKIKKQAEVEFGKGNVVIMDGHYQLFTSHKHTHTTGVKMTKLIETGCRIYAKVAEQKKRRSVTVNGKEVEAGPPDWTHECLCGVSPVVPQTERCAACTWGDYKHINGDW